MNNTYVHRQNYHRFYIEVVPSQPNGYKIYVLLTFLYVKEMCAIFYELKYNLSLPSIGIFLVKFGGIFEEENCVIQTDST